MCPLADRRGVVVRFFRHQEDRMRMRALEDVPLAQRPPRLLGAWWPRKHGEWESESVSAEWWHITAHGRVGYAEMLAMWAYPAMWSGPAPECETCGWRHDWDSVSARSMAAETGEIVCAECEQRRAAVQI